MKNLLLLTLPLSFFLSLSLYPPDLVKDVLSYTNDFRRSKRLTPLQINVDLNRIASKHSQDMANGRVGFGHDGYMQRYNQVRKAIKGARYFGENVAMGVRTGKDVVKMWERSPEHRKNMLGNYRYIGIGIATDRRGRTYYTQVFAN